MKQKNTITNPLTKLSTVKLRDDEKLHNSLIHGLRAYFDRERVEIHVSDLVYCLLKAYFRRTNRQELSERQLCYYTLGEDKHMILQKLGWETTEREVWKDDIVGHIDIYEGKPIEIKTTRKRKIIKTIYDVPETWILQIAAYTYMLNFTRASLIIWYDVLAEIHTKELIFMDKGFLNDVWNYLLKRKHILEYILRTNDLSNVPRPYAWECRDCEFKQICPRLKR